MTRHPATEPERAPVAMALPGVKPGKTVEVERYLNSTRVTIEEGSVNDIEDLRQSLSDIVEGR